MGIVGRSIVVIGEVRSQADLTVDGRVEGPVWCEGALTIAPSAIVSGKVVARDITVFGRAEGQLAATEVVDVRLGADVRADIVSPHFILHDGAKFNGRVDPAQLNAAVMVARFQQRQRDENTTNNGQLTTNNGRPATNNGQPAANNGQRTTDNGQRTTDNGQRTTDNGQRTTGN